MAGETVTSKQLREAASSLIAAVFAAQVGVTPPVVRKRWALGFESGQCPDVLRDGDKKVNGWLISVTDMSPDYLDEETDLELEALTIMRIWHVLQHNQGNDTANSQDMFEANCEAVQAAFQKLPGLGIGGGVEIKHNGLNFTEMDLYAFSNVTAHLAKGQVTFTINKYFDSE